MRLKTSIKLALTTTLLAGCVAPQQKPADSALSARAPHVFKPLEFQYDPKSPEVLNFSRQLALPALQCELEANTGGMAVRTGNRQMIEEYSNSLMECIKHSKSQGDEAIARLKAAKVPEKQIELSKDLYSKWSAYLMTMSAYRTTDHRAKAEYQVAREALATEVKFSN
ncbi:hypothetical protein WHX55_10920 [Pseudomonas fluorescens]|uniref:hypothetical protein n=1 Tax=Pseudomonas fluorescens TaxID=294 RepID=UPI0032532A45